MTTTDVKLQPQPNTEAETIIVDALSPRALLVVG